ncbi:MAG: helix-turn-helix domain-containing protein [Candidatus Moraniibacteriota bacterium]
MENELKQLGLTNNEIKVYKTLLEVGEVTVGPIIERLKIHRQVIYDALKGLIEKNMVIGVVKGRRNHYKISNPDNIFDNIKTKEQIAKNLIKEINQKLGGQTNRQEIKIYEGAQAYRELILRNDEKMPANSEIYILACLAEEHTKMLEVGGILEKSNKLRQDKNIKSKLLFSEAYRKEAINLKRINRECRFLRQEHTTPISIQIWHNCVTLISFGKEIFAIQMDSQDIHDAYLSYFKLLWKIAKK